MAVTRGHSGKQFVISLTEKCLNAIIQLTEAGKQMSPYDYLKIATVYCEEINSQLNQFIKEHEPSDGDNNNNDHSGGTMKQPDSTNAMDIVEYKKERAKYSDILRSGSGREKLLRIASEYGRK